jgi:hypothetical protein
LFLINIPDEFAKDVAFSKSAADLVGHLHFSRLSGTGPIDFKNRFLELKAEPFTGDVRLLGSSGHAFLEIVLRRVAAVLGRSKNSPLPILCPSPSGI